MKDIKLFDTLTKIEQITKGWSSDKKYCVETADGQRMLLRVSDISEYDRKKAAHEMMERVAALGIPMCVPIEFGICDDNALFQGGVCSLQSWIDGEDLEDILPLMSEAEQYDLGVQAGEIARKIHTIPAPSTQEEWAARFNRKTDYKIEKYRECGIRFEGDDAVIRYIEQNRGLIDGRPQSFQHGDYHVGNMMYAGSTVHIIDFDFDYGDPWQDFESIRWAVDRSVYFATGMVRGYFNNKVPEEFWALLKLYLAEGFFHNIVWSVNTGVQASIDTTLRQIRDVQNWFDGFKNTIPTWYMKDFYINSLEDDNE